MSLVMYYHGTKESQPRITQITQIKDKKPFLGCIVNAGNNNYNIFIYCIFIRVVRVIRGLFGWDPFWPEK